MRTAISAGESPATSRRSITRRWSGGSAASAVRSASRRSWPTSSAGSSMRSASRRTARFPTGLLRIPRSFGPPPSVTEAGPQGSHDQRAGGSPTCVQKALRRLLPVLAAVLALSSSLLWGTADFAGGLLTRRRAVLAVLLVSQAGAVAVALVLLAASGGPGPRAAGVAWGVGSGLLGVAALAAFYRGLALGTMSIVAPVAATGP